jgi:hypothetical protein
MLQLWFVTLTNGEVIIMLDNNERIVPAVKSLYMRTKIVITMAKIKRIYFISISLMLILKIQKHSYTLSYSGITNFGL